MSICSRIISVYVLEPMSGVLPPVIKKKIPMIIKLIDLDGSHIFSHTDLHKYLIQHIIVKLNYNYLILLLYIATRKIIPTFSKGINSFRRNNHSPSFLSILILPISYGRSSSVCKWIIILLFSISYGG